MSTHEQLLEDWFEHRTEQTIHWVRQQWRNPPSEEAAEKFRRHRLGYEMDNVKKAIYRLADEAFEFAETLSDLPGITEIVRDRLLEISLLLDGEINGVISAEEAMNGFKPHHKRLNSIKEFPRNYIRERYKVAAAKFRLDRTREAIAQNAKVQFEHKDVQAGAPKRASKPRSTSPSLPQADLNAWWESLGPTRADMTEDELLTDVHRQHPRNSISRDRIRELMGPRKRGRKPGFQSKSRKSPAN